MNIGKPLGHRSIGFTTHFQSGNSNRTLSSLERPLKPRWPRRSGKCSSEAAWRTPQTLPTKIKLLPFHSGFARFEGKERDDKKHSNRRRRNFRPCLRCQSEGKGI